MEVDYQQILPVVREYKEYSLEKQKILKDINDYKKQFKARLDFINKENEKLEKLILEFMERHKHPGIQDQDTTILRHDKKIKQSVNDRVDEIGNICVKYQINDRVLSEIKETIKGKSLTSPSLKLKYN